MRKVFLLALVVAACAKKEPAPDTTTPAAPPPPPPPPALTAADVKGTWNGTSRREGGDTNAVAWTVTSVTDSTSKLTFDKGKQTVDFSTKFDGDSMVAMSKPYNDPGLPKGAPKVVFRSVGRLKDGKLVGNSTIMLASKPDSVLAKGNWEATKAP